MGESCPVRRSGQAAVCLGYGEPRPQVLVTGGLSADNNVLSDAWILDVQLGHWKEVSRDIQIMLFFLPIMLCPNAQYLALLCSPEVPIMLIEKYFLVMLLRQFELSC